MSTGKLFLFIDTGFCRAEFFFGKNSQDWGLAIGRAGYPDLTA